MSVSDKVLAESRIIDWESLLKGFARQHDMHFKETLRWISNRTSLQVACEVLGVSLSPSLAARYSASDLAILNELGDILSFHGFEVPRLMEYHRLEYKRKGRPHMGFSLSREEYLRERALGKSKNKIAKEQGISGPALFHWLHKWGLKDVEVEQREIEALFALPSTAAASAVARISEEPPEGRDGSRAALEGRNNTQIVDPNLKSARLIQKSSVSGDGEESSGTSVMGGKELGSRANLQPIHSDWSTLHPISITVLNQFEVSPDVGVSLHSKSYQVKLTMPPVPVEVPDTLRITDLSRDETMVVGLSLLQRALGQAYRDLRGLLGETAAMQQIQQYIEYQLSKVIPTSNLTQPTEATFPTQK